MPIVSCLFGAIQGFEEPGSHSRWSGLARDVEVDGHVHVGLEVGGFDIDDLMFEVVLGGMRHLVAEGLHLANTCMCLDVIDPEALAVAFGDKACLEMVDRAHGVGLDLEEKVAVKGGRPCKNGVDIQL